MKMIGVLALGALYFSGCGHRRHHVGENQGSPYACTRATVRADDARAEAEIARQKPVDVAVLNVQLLAIGEKWNAKEVALASCASILSYRGSVAVVGRVLIIEETDERIQKVRDFVSALSAGPPATEGPQ